MSSENVDTRKERIRILVMIGLTLGLLLASLDATVVGTSLPRIVGDLGGISLFSWVITAYLLSSTITIPIAGKMSDRYGRKPLFLAGIIIFLGGSMLAGLSQSIGELIAFRFIQGIGGGVLIPIALATVADFYAPVERAKVLGALGAVSALAMVIGPFIGGFIVDNFDWRWVFYVNLPMGILAIAFSSMKFPKQTENLSKHLDYLGMSALAVSLSTLLLVITWGGNTYSWYSMEITGLAVLSILALIAFIGIERRAEDPVLPLHLFRNSVFSLSILGIFLVGFGLFAVLSFLPLFLQVVIGMSATNSGEVLIPLVIGLMITAIVSGFLIKRTGYKIWLLVGPPVAVLGLYLLSTLKVGSSQTDAIIYTFMIGCGLGMLVANYLVAAQNVTSKSDMGVGTSTTRLFQNLGGAVGVTVLGTIVNQQMVVELGRNLPAGAAATLPATDANTLGGLLLNPSAAAHIPASILDAIRLSLSNSLTYIFIIAAVLVLAALAVSIFIKSVPLKGVDADKEEE